jgi:trehalose 6-phosphate phosphatase
VEEKGLAVAVHTRRMADSEAAFDRLLPELEKLAERHDLVLEPGHEVIEVRSSGMHKGIAVRTLVDEVGAEGFLYAGDDLGDIEAFEALEALGADDVVAPLRVCADPRPGSRLRPIADVVVDGPAGVLDLLRRLTDDAAALRA